MAYIGKEPVVGNFQVCDAITVVNGQAAYSLTVGSAAVSPESANHMLVSLNGILQKPGSSFTISGSTMTFASNLATGDVIDFVQILGNVLDLGQPSDDTVKTASIQADAVTEAKIADDAVESEHLNNNIISGQTALAESPADTDEFLVSDGGTIKRIDYSHIKGGGAYTKLLTTTISSNTTNVDFNSTYVTSTYTDYMIIMSGVNLTNEHNIDMKISSDNGSSFKSDIHTGVSGYDSNNGTSSSYSDGSADKFTLTPKYMRAESDGNGWFEIHIFGTSDTANAVTATWTGGYEDNSNRSHAITGGCGLSDGTPHTTNFIRLTPGTGDFAKAIVTLYGRST